MPTPTIHLARLTALWKIVHESAAASTVRELQQRIAGIEHDFREFSAADLKKLQHLGKIWKGFGAAFAGDGPGLALFFGAEPDRELLAMLPEEARPENAEHVHGLKFELIRSATAPPPAVSDVTPGVDISWGCGTDYETHGTLGAFLVDQDGDRWMLSAHHVLGRIERCPHNTITIPSLCLISDEVIYAPARDCCVDNLADAAVARIPGEKSLDPKLPGVLPLVRSSHQAPAPGMEVVKVTAPPKPQTRGRIAYEQFLLDIDMSCCFLGRRHVHFKDQILIEDEPEKPFCMGGDSGSLVVYEDRERNESRALGLLIAKGVPHDSDARRFNVVTPMANVLKALQDASGRTFELLTRP
jgi:hypothetical protein